MKEKFKDCLPLTLTHESIYNSYKRKSMTVIMYNGQILRPDGTLLKSKVAHALKPLYLQEIKKLKRDDEIVLKELEDFLTKEYSYLSIVEQKTDKSVQLKITFDNYVGYRNIYISEATFIINKYNYKKIIEDSLKSLQSELEDEIIKYADVVKVLSSYSISNNKYKHLFNNNEIAIHKEIKKPATKKTKVFLTKDEKIYGYEEYVPEEELKAIEDELIFKKGDIVTIDFLKPNSEFSSYQIKMNTATKIVINNKQFFKELDDTFVVKSVTDDSVVVENDGVKITLDKCSVKIKEKRVLDEYNENSQKYSNAMQALKKMNTFKHGNFVSSKKAFVDNKAKFVVGLPHPEVPESNKFKYERITLEIDLPDSDLDKKDYLEEVQNRLVKQVKLFIKNYNKFFKKEVSEFIEKNPNIDFITVDLLEMLRHFKFTSITSLVKALRKTGTKNITELPDYYCTGLNYSFFEPDFIESVVKKLEMFGIISSFEVQTRYFDYLAYKVKYPIEIELSDLSNKKSDNHKQNLKLNKLAKKEKLETKDYLFLLNLIETNLQVISRNHETYFSLFNSNVASEVKDLIKIKYKFAKDKIEYKRVYREINKLIK